MTRVEWAKGAAQSQSLMVISTVAHVVTGALLLASAVILTIQIWRHLPVESRDRVSDLDREIIAA